MFAMGLRAIVYPPAVLRALLPAFLFAAAVAWQPPFDRLAEHIVHALEPVPDERIVLRADRETMPGLEPAVRRALERGGAVVETWEGADVERFEERLAAADVYVWLPGASRLTSAAQSAALRRWVDRGGHRRELHFHWSEGTLRADATPAPHTPAADDLYAEALEIDYAGLKNRHDAAIELLRSGVVRVTTPASTDLRFRTGDRPFNRQDGDAARRRVARARVRVDRHVELPAGILRVAPIETSVNGTLVVPARMLRLEFVDGKAALGAGDVEFREFGLGFNPALAPRPGLGFVPYYGYGAGVVRLSLGDNEELGGQVRGAPVQWNFFTDATVTVGERVVVEKGKLR
jgi:hypothetical protein